MPCSNLCLREGRCDVARRVLGSASASLCPESRVQPHRLRRIQGAEYREFIQTLTDEELIKAGKQLGFYAAMSSRRL